MPNLCSPDNTTQELQEKPDDIVNVLSFTKEHRHTVRFSSNTLILIYRYCSIAFSKAALTALASSQMISTAY